MGLFKAHLARRLWNDDRLRAICGIEREEPAYGRTVLSRFNQRLGARRLGRIVDKQVKKLLKKLFANPRIVAMDATFIKAYSRRNMNNQTGFSDPQARVGRAYRTYGLGYKLHLTVDADTATPLAFLVAPANTNEKKLSIPLLVMTAKTTDTTIQKLTADSQYSSHNLRETAQRYRIKTAIPYPAIQKPNRQNILRVTSGFKTHGPENLKHIYDKRSIIELSLIHI